MHNMIRHCTIDCNSRVGKVLCTISTTKTKRETYISCLHSYVIFRSCTWNNLIFYTWSDTTFFFFFSVNKFLFLIKKKKTSKQLSEFVSMIQYDVYNNILINTKHFIFLVYNYVRRKNIICDNIDQYNSYFHLSK